MPKKNVKTTNTTIDLVNKINTESLNRESRHRGWVFTWNNYEEINWELVQKRFEKTAKYFCVGKEVGESGTPHLQGCITFKDAQPLSTLKNYNPSIHWEKRIASEAIASEYCKKEGKFIEFGSPSKQGERTDLQVIKDKILEGSSIKEIILDAKHIGQVKSALTLIPFLSKKRNFKTEVHWFYGPAGSGKTRTAVELLGENYYHMSGSNLKWWPGYSGEKKVLIDDFRSTACEYSYLLNLLDRYPMSVEQKGTYSQFLAEVVIITCPYSPEEAFSSYKDDKDNLQQLLRRIDTIRHFKLPLGVTPHTPQRIEGSLFATDLA